MATTRKVTVIGIGQTLRGDDAAGMEAVRRWQETFPDTSRRPEIIAQFSELPGLGLLDLLDGFDAALLVDAVQSSAQPGHIHRLGIEDLAAFGTETKSAHGWGVAESVQLGMQVNPSLAAVHIRLIGIEAQQVQLGQQMSGPVLAAIPDACQAIEKEIQALLA